MRADEATSYDRPLPPSARVAGCASGTRVAPAVPLIAIGSQAAHALDYEFVIPGSRRAGVLEATGHSYLNVAPQFLAISFSLILVAFVWRIGARAAGSSVESRPGRSPCLPPLAFALQEHLERFLHSGDVPWTAALEPTFLPGVLLQLPFALLAYAIARALLGAAGLISRLLRREQRAPPVAARPRVACSSGVHRPAHLAAGLRLLAARASRAFSGLIAVRRHRRRATT